MLNFAEINAQLMLSGYEGGKRLIYELITRALRNNLFRLGSWRVHEIESFAAAATKVFQGLPFLRIKIDVEVQGFSTFLLLS